MPHSLPKRVADEPKMVLVVRGDLRLTPGKAAVQVAHAAVLLAQRAASGKPDPIYKGWVASGQRKIAVVAPTLEAMRTLDREARAIGLPTVWVEDAGFTEVAPGTVTCLGVGPGRPAEVDRVTGSLPLL